MGLRKNIQRFINSFKPRQPTWSDKKSNTNFLFKHDHSLKADEIRAIYMEPSYRADGSYLTEINRILENDLYYKVLSLSTTTLWGEDEMGEIPIGDRVHFYIILFKNDAVLLKAVFYHYEPVHTLFIKEKIIALNNLKYFKLNKKIFPYE